ncbi:MAG: carboxylesterase family protein, partial [Lachnospiraceae bacterium]|nr:carboxylesterase family protein [Lachnospiraceae bacterium]
SVAYRLNVFGFLSEKEISDENPDTPGNFGLLDQRAGLNWVVENIAAFGGDPDRITIAGQSAGGGSVLQQLTSAYDNSAIKGAVILSGIINSDGSVEDIFNPISLSEAEERGRKFFDFMGFKDLSEARKASSQELLSGYNRFQREGGGKMMVPINDGKFCIGNPTDRLCDRQCVDVPIITGNTADEFTFGGVNIVEKSVKNALPKMAKNATDQKFWYYRFDSDIPGDGAGKEAYPGTFHSCDLWFFFDTLEKCHRPYTGRHFELARQMSDYFVNFVKTGDPNGKGYDGKQLPTWGTYSKENPNEMEFLPCGAVPKVEGGIRQNGRKQGVNPYLPSWEYIPDGEPYVFGDRVYVYGSHDILRGETFCLGDYVCWSAPINDLGNWKYEGVIFPKTDDPFNPDGHMCLYAPDVTVGPDGKYYLYYVLDKVSVVSVAVADTPVGPFKFIGYVHYEDGTRLGDKEGDEPQFDPGVLTEGDTTYLFTGFAGHDDKSRHGAMLTLLDKDMLTVKKAPVFVAPGDMYDEGTGYEGHAFFEAPSIRKHGDTYYFIYSSEVMHELCYATSKSPEGPFVYGGVIVSNCDIGIDSYKPADAPTCFGANNHGSIVQIGDDWYIFYHRHTHGTWYSRQGCAEKIHFEEDGSIKQVEITSCGLNNGPLSDIGEYPAYIACNIFCRGEETDDSNPFKKGIYVNPSQPRIVQEGIENDYGYSYIKAIVDGTTVGFKYFGMKDVTGLKIKTRAYYHGKFEIRTAYGGEVIGEIKGDGSNIWVEGSCTFKEKVSGVLPLYLTYVGGGTPSLKSVELLH